MQRFWLWIIPLLAAICTICIQALLHAAPPGRFTVFTPSKINSPSLLEERHCDLGGFSERIPDGRFIVLPSCADTSFTDR